MGGKALQKYGVSRLDQDTYDRVSTQTLEAINAALKSLGSTESAVLVPSCRDKTDHGDIDVVVPHDSFGGNPDKLVHRLAKELGVEKIEFRKFGNMANCVLIEGEKAYQLDLICVKDEALQFAVSYLSWNDVSTILLRVTSRMGLSIGINGLSYSVKEGTNKLGRVMLTRDFKVALEYLCLDADRWNQGFNNLEEVYEFFSEWKGFHPKVFSLDRLNEADRKGVLKRPGYMNFIEWVNAHPEKHKRVNWFPYSQALRENLWQLFPAAKVEFDAIFSDIQRQKDCQKKFNGHLISEITGYERKELGDFITQFKAQFASKREFEGYVMNTDQDTIVADIKTAYENTKSK